jgi:hypothetical protein
MKHKLLSLLIISVVASLMVMMSGCNKIENLSNSGSRLIVDLITGRGVDKQYGSTTVFSDVITINAKKEVIIENDDATATLRAEVLNPAPNNVSNYQDVIVDQIDISYTRSDRPNAVEGKDVPYGFSQRVNFLVEVSSSVQYSFVLVQHIAKVESPLVELRYNGLVIKLEANMTFYGKDLAGKRVTPVNTSISVWCADFFDE